LTAKSGDDPIGSRNLPTITTNLTGGNGGLLMNNSLNEKITRVAYELYERSGNREGNDLLNWLAAEKIVHFQQIISPAIGREAIALLEYKPLAGAESARPTSNTSSKSRSRFRKVQKGRNPEIRTGL
jgi:hypothetical protein